MGELVRLERGESVGPYTERLLELPKYVATARRGRGGDPYWHIPRLGWRWDDGHVGVSCWCGQGLGTAGLITTPERPPARVCGTCEGRFNGARAEDDTVFSPRRDPWAIPTWCPSTYVDAYGFCVACDYRPRATWWGGVGRHRPTGRFTELVGPCPDHGYRHAIVAADGNIICGRHVGHGFGRCDFPMKRGSIRG